MASVTSPAGEEELVVLYEITVRVGKQELAGARRRYREFHKLHHVLSENYPHLLADASSSSYDPHDEDAGPLSVTPPRPRTSSASVALPPFPRKHLFRAGWDPAVVIERVTKLNAWLAAVTDKLQFASLELVGFLNVPLYAAIRLLSGDLQVRKPHNRTALVPQRSPQPPAQRGETPSVIFLINPPSTPLSRHDTTGQRPDRAALSRFGDDRPGRRGVRTRLRLESKPCRRPEPYAAQCSRPKAVPIATVRP